MFQLASSEIEAEEQSRKGKSRLATAIISTLCRDEVLGIRQCSVTTFWDYQVALRDLRRVQCLLHDH